jgi:hypothetical protein
MPVEAPSHGEPAEPGAHDHDVRSHTHGTPPGGLVNHFTIGNG